MAKDNVYINGRFLTQPSTGVQRFALELLSALDRNLENEMDFIQDNNLICLVPNEIDVLLLPNWVNISIQKCGKLPGNLWEQIELPFFARNGLLVNLCNIGPIFHCNQIIVLHDVSVFAVPEAYSFAFKFKYKFIMSVLAHTAKQVLTVSKFSQNELVHYLRISKDKITTISEGCEHILRTLPDNNVLINNKLDQQPFLLAVGSSSPHKNMENLIKAVETDLNNPVKLVIVGGSYSKVFKDVKIVNSEKIIQLGYVTNGELRSLYSHAIGFIFPSLYEGFGLPPLEAMTCGCPVLCSNLASMPEVCGEAAIYFDPLNINEIIGQMQYIINNLDIRNKLKQKGFKRVLQYTWRNSAQGLFIVINRFLK